MASPATTFSFFTLVQRQAAGVLRGETSCCEARSEAPAGNRRTVIRSGRYDAHLCPRRDWSYNPTVKTRS